MSGALACPDCDGLLDPDHGRCPFCQRRLATRACDVCGRRTLVLAEVCASCGSALSREDARDLADTACPVCEVPLVVRDAHGVRLHECGRCGGVFLDHESFERATEDGEVRASLHFRESLTPYRGSMPPAVASAPEPAADAPFYRRCPACRTLMGRVNFARRSAVMLDVCPRHGTWFDRDELLRALSFVERGGLDEARRREREERDAEKARAAKASVQSEIATLSEPVSLWGAELAGLSQLVRLIGAALGWRVRR